MSEWNFDISQAPKGRYVKSLLTDKNGKTSEIEKFVPDMVILCAADEKMTVTRSFWKPNVERWEFFATGQQPLAWMPYPKHPNRNIAGKGELK